MFHTSSTHAIMLLYSTMVCLSMLRFLGFTCLCVASLTFRIFPLSGNTPYRSRPITPKPDTARDLAESPSVRIRVHSEECFPPTRQNEGYSRMNQAFKNSFFIFTVGLLLRSHLPNTEAAKIKLQLPNEDFFTLI